MSLVGFQSQNHPQQTRYRGRSRHVDDRGLPPDEFAKLHQRFRFSIDVAASPHNAKLDRFLSEKENGLTASWSFERVYCNPPYSDIAPWVEKAWSERFAELIVMLLPANRTEQRWWQEGIEPRRDRCGSPLRVEFLPGRIRFLKAGQDKIGPNERPPLRVRPGDLEFFPSTVKYPSRLGPEIVLLPDQPTKTMTAEETALADKNTNCRKGSIPFRHAQEQQPE